MVAGVFQLVNDDIDSFIVNHSHYSFIHQILSTYELCHLDELGVFVLEQNTESLDSVTVQRPPINVKFRLRPNELTPP